MQELWQAFDAVLGGGETSALLVVGPPRCGKTEFAFEALMRALERNHGGGAMMTVSGRVTADRLGNRAIRRMGASMKARPVTTLSALAFAVIADARRYEDLPAPRLLNGAEQDALLRRVVAAHLDHAEAGNLCDTCVLLREYFADDRWTDTVAPAREQSGGATTMAMFERGVSSSFVDQLRDMLARINELGASFAHEREYVGEAAGTGRNADRTAVQWRLAFALRREYVRAIEHTYPGEYRLDASRLLVEAAAVLRRVQVEEVRLQPETVPSVLVVDDFHDATLAGLRFLEALSAAGVRLVLVGNPDEAVQTFRGSYPEYLMGCAVRGPLHAALHRIPVSDTPADAAAPTYRDLLASRISLSIPSPEPDDTPMPQRPGKLPRYAGSLPIRRLDAPGANVDAGLGASPLEDGTVSTALYKSPREEMDDVVWRMKRLHLDRGIAWNDMAIIAHDNATVRSFGERLRRDGVPVRYSSVTRPLKDEPFVQGLFALIELALLRRRGIDAVDLPLAALSSYVRARVATLMACPLVTAGTQSAEGAPARLAPVESAMAALESLAGVVQESAETAGAEGQRHLAALIESWDRYRDAVDERRQAARRAAAVSVDDGVLTGESADDELPFGQHAMYLMLAFDDPKAPATPVLDSLGAILGRDPQAVAFRRMWDMVGRVADGMGRLSNREAQYTLALAWNATGVAGVWQRAALRNDVAGRAANDRLDVAMRLFQFAADGSAGEDIVAFMDQVRSMQIEADSLAHVGPIEQAVTLTTPAGAAGNHWRHVWLPAVQQDVWPNLAERATLFGGEDLADLMLHGRIGGVDPAGCDPRLAAVLSSEKKNLLVAVTRADETLTISATWNEDCTPSDFLYGYLPERFIRQRDEAVFTRPGGQSADDDAESHAGLDADPRGLVTAARIALACHGADSPEGRDAASALALLAEHGVRAADPKQWYFVDTADEDTSDGGPEGRSGSRNERHTVTLSPSSVDSIWSCPVCWLLERRCSGPQSGGVRAGFGTLVHEVAQRGSEERLDMPGAVAAEGAGNRIAAVSERLMAIYRSLRRDPQTIESPTDRYAALQLDRSAETMMTHIASYFVNGCDAAYPFRNAQYMSVGALERAECEAEFTARFDIDDMLAAYNAIPGIEPMTSGELLAVMGTLVGGWPEGMCDDLTIRLSGRIDRLEHRRYQDGREAVRLIDYKTGRKYAITQIFNDLQLVCYQLGLAFPEDRGCVGPSPRMPYIAQSGLFFVREDDGPSRSREVESLHQPALLRNGAWNTEPFTLRYCFKDPQYLEIPELPETPPAGVRAAAWDQIVRLRGSQTLWALTMVARVFYAAAASRSSLLIAHPTPDHVKHCRMKASCPACAGELNTVYETRQA
ncbi:PD-(D/E)XK nuclease family protein [Bifidobacterium saeculare]|uniref:PD-(D/E)XK nuclease family protein n=1 Tax=Bifidobacterium pullorum TaxID=78448 RepID=UPI001874A72F|nr:PD-(D/E)XK nuclease family protein [Bifidobacterium pullorum]MBE5064771.1 PD-(D/E)XK nuclease family protein [Bifidobacterium pullorum subsp. saeculare]